MFAQLQMELSASEKFNYNKASVLQGVMFEKIDTEYAEYLHSQSLHPYSQYVYCEEDKLFWVINTLDEESYNHIILKLMSADFSSFSINRDDIEVKVRNKTIRVLRKEELMSELDQSLSDRNIDVEIRTPMSFKQRGSYVCFPDLRLIYQSLMNRYSSISENMVMMDEDTLFQMVDNSVITKYGIRSAVFHLEGTTIPGALGYMRIRVKGPELMAKYARMLFRFAEFSGIGAKTGMGMGAVTVKMGE